MLTEYKTVQQYGHAEIVIRKSRFIGHAAPVASEQEAIDFVERIKKENGTATHNCSAYLFGDRDEFQKQSDDGEPSGTAGKPILEVIKHQSLKNIAVVVTRYFGGIMLGAGGLIRAYTDGAVAGIEAAGAINQVLHQQIRLHIDYTWLGKIENALRSRNILVGETQFADKVTINCLPYYTEREGFIAWMTDFTAGQANIELGETHYKAHPIGKG